MKKQHNSRFAKSKQRGFTLIEVMSTVAIVGVISAVALPAYADYTRRAKITEVIGTASACRTAITEAYQMAPDNMPSANAWGCEGISGNSKYVQSISTNADGKITIVAQNFGDASIDGRTIELTPLKLETASSGSGTGGMTESGLLAGSGGNDDGTSDANGDSSSGEEFPGMLPADVSPMTATSPGVVYA